MGRKAADEAFQYYRRLRRLDEYVRANVGHSISASEAARIVSLDYRYFGTRFRARTGFTFTNWLAEVRLEHAEEMFRVHNYTVLEAGLAAGFGSEDTFRRACKRHRGMTPGELKAWIRRGGGGRRYR